ncbi:MAG: glycosyltransferase [Sulfobacillus sp.]
MRPDNATTDRSPYQVTAAGEDKPGGKDSRTLDVTVSIVTGGSADYLRGCIESIFVTRGDLEVDVVVVDNCAPYDTAALLQDYPQVAILRNAQRQGLAANQNQILAGSRSSYVFVLNDDTVLLPGCMQALVEALESHPRTSMAVPLIYNDMSLSSIQANVGVRYLTPAWALLQELVNLTPFIGIAWIRRFCFREFEPMRRSGPARLVGGAGMMVRGSCLASVGLMEERYGLYYEEMDWCLRMRRQGWELRTVADARMVHFGGGTTRESPAFYVQTQRASRERYLRKWYPGAAWLIFDVLVAGVRCVLQCVRALLSRGGQSNAR